MCIIDIDDGGFQTRPCKQPGLGLPVGIHAAVVVQVILGEIGKDGGVDLRAIQAMFLNADRRSFDGTGSNALGCIVGKSLLQAHGVWRGHAGGLYRRWHANPQRTDHGAALAHAVLVLRQRMRQPPGCRRLAIGTSHRQHLQLARGLAIPGIRNQGGRRLQTRHAGHRPLQVKGLQAILLDQASCCAALQRCCHIFAAIGDTTWPCNKTIAGLHLTAVGA